MYISLQLGKKLNVLFSKDAKHVLEYVFAHIVEFKKLNQDFQDED